MGFLSFCLLSLLAVTSTNAGILTLQSPRISVHTSSAQQPRSEPLSLARKPEPLTLNTSDVLKLSFQVVEKDEGKGVQPHQTFLRFYDKVSGEEGIQPIRVSSAGKAKFELNMARPPTSLPPTTATDPLAVSLIIGSFEHSPVKYELFDLYLPQSRPAPQHPDEPAFHPRPVIEHTFHPEQKLPPKPVSAVFAALVLSPWVVLLGLWAHIGTSVPHITTPGVASFILSLATFEGLLFWYWVDLKLGQVLFYGAFVSVLTAVTGKQALVARGNWRLGRK